MLVLARKKNEEIIIGSGPDAIVLKVIEITPDRVKLGVQAPAAMNVLRKELIKLGEKKDGLERSDDRQSIPAV